MATVGSWGGVGVVVIDIPLGCGAGVRWASGAWGHPLARVPPGAARPACWLSHEGTLGAGLEPASGRMTVPPRSTAELPQRVLRAGLEPASSRIPVPAALPLSYLSKVR